MKVSEMIAVLAHMNPDAEVFAYDPQTEGREPVTGFTWSSDQVVIETDDMNF